MPKGVYDRLSAKQRTIKGVIKQYVEFCFRDDIAKKLELTAEPWLLGVQLLPFWLDGIANYLVEISIDFSPNVDFRGYK